MTPGLSASIETVLRLLARCEYETLEAVTRGKRLAATEIRHAIEEYGRTIVMPPDIFPSDLEFYGEPDENRSVLAVMSLWTEEEGRSDLSIELTLIPVSTDLWNVEIDNIRVL